MAYLYQLINTVPGLSGSGFEKQRQLYQRLGSPMGNYSGSRDQNLYLLDQINKKNFGAAQPAAAPAAPTAPAVNPVDTLAQSAANLAGAESVYKGPVFSQVMPFDQTWNSLLPDVTAEAHQQVDPFISRQLNKDSYAFNNSMANTGGYRFGRTAGGIGDIKAASQSNEKANLLDWINQRQQGFKQLFYDPAQQAWTEAMKLGQAPSAPKIPTWQEYVNSSGMPTS